MPTIKVDHPFSLRVSSDAELREFDKGQHTVTTAELEHWFIQGCLKEGRATLVSDADIEPAPEQPQPSRTKGK